LRVIGGWENFLGVVNFTRFNAAGYGAGPLQKDELAKGMREVADAVRVRWPHQEWSAMAAKAKQARHELAHMLYIFSVTGEMPDRTINIARLGEEGKPRKAPRMVGEADESGPGHGLSLGQQATHRDTTTRTVNPLRGTSRLTCTDAEQLAAALEARDGSA